jgi:hypothetical protein
VVRISNERATYTREVSGGLFLKRGDNLAELTEQPYDAESVLQRLLADHPQLLAGGDIDPDDPRRFVLVRREAPVANLSLDHLFVDQDAIPTLVETKRGADIRGRREVVAQMLDYAANAATQWKAERLCEWHAERCQANGIDPDDDLASIEHSLGGADAFWARAGENLLAGNVRLIFISDSIPDGLQVIVEFLNERMTPTEVLAIEVRQFSAGEDQILQARLLGQTARAREVKVRSGSRRPPVIGVLMEAGELVDGRDLWLLPSAIPAAHRPAPDDPRLRVRLVVADGSPRFAYQPPGQEQAEDFAPSAAWIRIRTEIEPGFQTDRRFARVDTSYSVEPGGPPLAEIAAARGLW